MLSTEGSNCGTYMAPAGSEANDSSKEETPLIQGLPDDVAVLCLARVPRTYHANLKCVSKRWKKLVCGEGWRIVRKKYNLEETWIYAFCHNLYGKGGMPEYCFYVLDPYASRRCWKRIQDLPPCIVQRQSMKFEVLGQKAYLIGGRDFTESEWLNASSDDDIPTADEVHCYDGMTNSWSKAAPLSTPRCHFASEVLDGKIYAVGSDGKHTWEAYDPVTNIWKANSIPRFMDGGLIESIAYDGKLYVRYGTYSEDGLSDACGFAYDPSTDMWHDVDDEMLLGWHGTSVVADGRLYCLDRDRYMLMTWDEEKKKWISLVNLASVLMTQAVPTCYLLVAVGKSIYVIGKGLFTVELDVSNVGKGGGGGVLPTTEVTGPIVVGGDPTFCYLMEPLICKGMTI